MMLRTEKQIALDAVINSGRASIEHYRQAADACDDEPLATLLRTLVLQRETVVDNLAEQMYRLGDMPSSPDPEKLAVEEVLTRIKATFSEDQTNALLAHLEELDSQLLQTIGEGQRLDFDRETLAILAELQESIAEARRKRASYGSRF
jgi:uncharacterized protein YicC (UPF0701 family)